MIDKKRILTLAINSIKTKIHVFKNKLFYQYPKENIHNIHKENITDIGIFYIAFGDKYVNEAVHSSKSVKEVSTIKTAILCDKIDEELKKYFDFINFIRPKHIRAKVDYLECTPFEYTLYLDSDTQVMEDISYLFDILKKYDIAFTHDFARKRYRWSQLIKEYDDIPDGFSELGGGVMLYRKSKAIEFIQLWKYYFYKYYNITNGWDQASLRIAAWRSKSNLYILPIEFNVRSEQNRAKVDLVHKNEGGLHPLRPRILHYHDLNNPKIEIKSYKY